MYKDLETCSHCREVVRINNMVGNLCRWCDDELYPNEDPLAGDVDRHPEQLVEVSYPGPNGPEVHYEPETFLNWCDMCGDEIEAEEGRICPECREELEMNN